MMNSDYAHLKTDKIILKMEKRINRKYLGAYKDLKKQLNKYLMRFSAKEKEQLKRLNDGFISKEQFEMWRLSEIMLGADYTKTQHQLAELLSLYDKEAMQIIKDNLTEIYALNMNYATFSIESSINIDTTFTLYDKWTVERLLLENPKLLPDPNPTGSIARAIIERKRMRWNEQHINSVMYQGILQGESIPKIAKNLQKVTDMNRRSAIRNARTMATSAENGGREASYKRAEDMGIDLMRVWVATLDGRTRHEHRLLDGQQRRVGQPFEVNGYKIKYPADPDASPHLVYNCRCCTVAKVKGVNFDMTDTTKRKNKLGSMTYEQWKHQHEVKNV